MLCCYPQGKPWFFSAAAIKNFCQTDWRKQRDGPIDKRLHDRTMNRTIWKEERMRDMREQSDDKARQIEEKEEAELNADKEANYASVDG